MKKPLTVALVALMAVTAQAEAKPIDAETCEAVSTLAEAVMQARQYGMSAAEMVESARNDELIIGLIKDSYRAPLYNSESDKKRAVTEFGSKYYLACLSIEE